LALSEGGRRAAIGAALALVTLAVYAPVRHYGWVDYDDDVYVYANPSITLGLGPAGVAWAFTTFHGANWFPLTWLSWMLDVQLFGLAPGPLHVVNALLHATAAALLFVALARMSGAPGRSAFAAAVFALHPLHVESVAWIAARKDVLSGLFFALALGAHERRARLGPGRGRSALLALFLALGLMAKPTLVVLPFLLLLLDFWPLGRLGDEPGRIDPARLSAAVREKGLLFGLAAASAVITYVAQRAGGAVAGTDLLPFGPRLENALVALARYLGKAFWPADLAVLYPHPGTSLPLWQPASAAGLLVAVTAAVVVARRRAPYLATGWLWFTGALVPVLGLVQVGSQAMADRYTYLPLVGLAIAVAWGAWDLLGRGRRRRAALAVLAGAAIAAQAACTRVQLRYWRDGVTLFEHALAVTDENHVAHAQLGAALLARGREGEAIAHWKEAVRIAPGYLEAANNLAWQLATSSDASLRDPYLAVQLAERARKLAEPGDPAVLDSLAAAYAAAGRFAQAQKLAGRAARLAGTRGETALAAAIAERRALYAEQRPYVQPERSESAQ
jgi:protein O-mannosyl-transferase